jgi:hypothetical protein
LRPAASNFWHFKGFLVSTGKRGKFQQGWDCLPFSSQFIMKSQVFDAILALNIQVGLIPDNSTVAQISTVRIMTYNEKPRD